MSQPVFLIRPMVMSDLDKVREIDKLSFSLPWPDSAFQYELVDNQNSCCWVVERQSPENGEELVAYSVVWLVIDEAHLATIAVHADYRGQGVGKLLLEYIIQDAVQRGMLTVLLEVRAGNRVAQQMYRKYGFEEVGRRPRYYQDNQEDAILMTLELTQAGFRRVASSCQPSADEPGQVPW